SLREIEAMVEPELMNTIAGQQVQFERNGYFVADAIDSRQHAPVFNRIVPLKDSWAKEVAKGARGR
ncbi:MAG: glutamine--tRNA ligase, partial [Pirellulaceae bacterium]